MIISLNRWVLKVKAAEDDMTDVYLLQLKLSILQESNTLGVRISKKGQGFMGWVNINPVSGLPSGFLFIFICSTVLSSLLFNCAFKFVGIYVKFNGINHLLLNDDDTVGMLETDNTKDLKPLNDRVLIKDMYDFMALDRPSTPLIDRGIALHKMIRLITMGLGGEGYLNFMGNEFGHPEWIDFPRADQRLPDGRFIPGNGNSFDKCRRRFDLGDADYLRYHGLQQFDEAMQHLEEAHNFMTSGHQYISRKHEGEKLKIALDSDDSLFGGFNRLDHEAEFFTFEGSHDNRPRSFMVYAPARTAVVYKLVTDSVGLK
ncbi:hypothetical protein L2E82_35785 [Cichorium intybus]|uniref:Uncharacterized protein n=1 Tax=Cichorium intybus TaxID=13427 RepID=A0ACB9BPQ4_CICIN|nr:hypothetical protein L2E82_35785 [Cichorium intybus]